jgi:hypothetical protein
MGHYTDQAAVIVGPTSTTRKAVLANTAAPTALDLIGFSGAWVIVKCNVKTHYRFSSTSTAASITTTDIYLTPDVDYPFYIPVGGARRYLKFKGGGTAGFIYAAGPCSDALDG